MANTNSVEFSSKVYSRAGLDTVLDRQFKEFGQTTVEATKTVEQFFADYEDLYYSIPIEGTTASHQYLVEKSSELYKASDPLADIQPLLDEITLLRSQSVADQQTIIELRAKIAEQGAYGTN